MNYADFGMGTWHPKTGMFDVVRAMESLARELGVTFHTNSILKNHSRK
jgi:phytoene desaturase